MTTTNAHDYTAALKQGKAVGASQATDSQAMALFCESSIQILCGAVSPALVWEGAMKKGLTVTELGKLASTDPGAVADLMWV